MAEANQDPLSDEEAERQAYHRDMARLKKAVDALKPYFDSVQIIATTFDGTMTGLRAWGMGNWYARKGSIKEWVLRDDEDSREITRQNRRDDE